MSQNRKQRTKILPSLEEQKRARLAEEEEVMAARRANQNQIQQEVADLLDGKTSTEDPVTLYLIESLKDASAERIAVAKNLQQAEQAVVQLRNRMVELKGINSKMLEDLSGRVTKDKPTEKKLEAVPEIKEPEHKEPDPEPVV